MKGFSDAEVSGHIYMCAWMSKSAQTAHSRESAEGMGGLCGEVNSIFYLRSSELLEIC